MTETNVLQPVLDEGISYNPSTSTYDLAVDQGDLNGDGTPDLIFVDTQTGQSDVILATATGFSLTQQIPGDYLDGETTVGSTSNGTVYLISRDFEGEPPGAVYRDDGTGNFVYQPQYVDFSTPPTLTTYFGSVAFGKGGPTQDTVAFNADGTITVSPPSTGGAYASVTYSLPSGLPYAPTAANLLAVISSGQQFALVFAPRSAASFNNTIEVLAGALEAACYVAGTRLLTPGGERAIEALRAGDLVATASGAVRAVRWVGRRAIDCARHPQPERVWPVRVAAGAFGPGLPHAELWLSPGHAVRVQGGLVPVELLVNGATIEQVPVACVTYHHVELDAHDLVLAHGLAAESYLDVGNRHVFEGEGMLALHPDLSAAVASGEGTARCLPLLGWGESVVEARARLLERAGALGHATDAAHGLHLLADGVVVAPSLVSGEWHHFAVPEGAQRVVLASRTWTPAHVQADSTDGRRLGVCVLALVLDGQAHPLNAAPPAAKGWHEPCLEGMLHRWTDGAAALPAGLRSVAVLLGGERRYRSVPTDQRMQAA